MVTAVLLWRVEEQAGSCPQGHRLADWLDENGEPLRRGSVPWRPEERVCPACKELELARNRPGEHEEPGAYWTFTATERDG